MGGVFRSLPPNCRAWGELWRSPATTVLTCWPCPRPGNRDFSLLYRPSRIFPLDQAWAIFGHEGKSSQEQEMGLALGRHMLKWSALPRALPAELLTGRPSICSVVSCCIAKLISQSRPATSFEYSPTPCPGLAAKRNPAWAVRFPGSSIHHGCRGESICHLLGGCAAPIYSVYMLVYGLPHDTTAWSTIPSVLFCLPSRITFASRSRHCSSASTLLELGSPRGSSAPAEPSVIPFLIYILTRIPFSRHSLSQLW